MTQTPDLILKVTQDAADPGDTPLGRPPLGSCQASPGGVPSVLVVPLIPCLHASDTD